MLITADSERDYAQVVVQVSVKWSLEFESCLSASVCKPSYEGSLIYVRKKK